MGAIRPALLSLIATLFLLARHSEPWTALRTGRVHSTLPLLAVLYFSLALVGAPLSVWPGGALDVAMDMLPSLLICTAVAVAITDGFGQLLSRVIIYALAATSLVQIFAGIEEAGGGGRFSVGATLDPNDLGTLLAAGLPLAVALISIEKRAVFRAASLFSACLMLAALARTGSRGAFVSLCVGVVTYVMMTRGARKFAYLAFAVASLTMLVSFGPQTFRARITSMLVGEKDYNYTDRGGRLAVWNRGLRHALANPVFGVGIGNFPIAEGAMLRAEGKTGLWQAPHNAFVQAAAELGFPGVATLVALVIISLRQLYRRARQITAEALDRAWLASCAGFIVGSLFLSNAYSPTVFLLAGVAAGSVRSFATPSRGGTVKSRRLLRGRPHTASATPV